MNQVTSLIADAEIEQANLIREIKGEYLTQARALAYVLDASELSTFSTAFLREKRELISVDEINIFDENGVITLGDEVLTPDNSRFWPREGYEIGHDQPSYDKQFARNWLKANEGHNWTLPQEIVDKTIGKYVEAYEVLTEEKF